jgi:hypothetical protein
MSGREGLSGIRSCATEGEVSDHRFVKKHGGAKHSLEAIHKTAMSFPVFEQAEEIEDFERVPEAHDTAALTNGNGRHTDGN